MGYQDGLTFQASELDPLGALRQPTSALLGVSPGAEATLAALGIETVFDLAASPLFAAAAEIAAAARQSTGRMSAVGVVPGELLTAGAPDDPEAVAEAGVEALRPIGVANEAAVRRDLLISTVADLGRWPPYVAARDVLRAAIGAPDADDTANLVPRLGEFPTERRYYSTVVIDHVENAAATDLLAAGPIDIAPVATQDLGFSAPAVGARLTFAQSWYAHGLTLGNLLHSVALAPGESTRIAVLDWARQSRGRADEGISETEQLSNVTQHNRAMSEVQDAVATEVQTGFSHTESSSTTKAGGGGFGFSAGPISIGGSASIGKSSTEAESFSSSFGARNLSASMNQRITDATQQAASSVRDRRASIVQEVSESEQESVSTRILANYNHMHALTVQYFEVVEVYRAVVDLHRVERCLFIPMKIVEFTDEIIQSFQGVLAAAALDPRARALLTTEFGVVRLSPTLRMSPFPNVFDRLDDLAPLTVSAFQPAGGEGTPGAAAPPPATRVTRASRRTDGVTVAESWDAHEVSRIGRTTGISVLRPGSSDLFLPDEASLEGVGLTIDASGGQTPAPPAVSLLRRDGSRVAGTASVGGASFPAPVPLVDIERIEAMRGEAPLRGQLVLQLSYRGTRFPVSFRIDVAAGNGRQDVATLGSSEAGKELTEHLNANRLHYSQAIWRSLDSSTIALLLSQFTWEGRAVIDQVDPTPILVAGNYLTFRMPGFSETAGIPTRRGANEDAATTASLDAWESWLDLHGIVLGREAGAEQLVPISTGGVFAEAVLGRSNSAEKLDATRFWNWQDSPIPLQPPEIAAITMQSRHDPGTTPTPGELGQPVLNIVNPTQLPDPTGVGAILNALQSGSMFRDMSGLAATIGLAQSTGSDATTAGTEAGRQAAANLAVAAQKEIEMARIAAQVAMASMGLPAASSGTPKNASEMGALLNAESQHGAKGKAAPDGGLDAPTADESGGETSGGAEDSSVSGGGEATDADFMPGVSGSEGSSGTAFERALWGTLGMPAGNLVLAGAKTKKPATKSTGVEVAVLATFESPWANATAETKNLRKENNAHWSPTSVDFRAIAGAVVGTRTREIGKLGQLLGAILELSENGKKKIKRLNLFTHANPSNLAMRGTVKANGDVGLGIPDPADPMESPGVDTDTLEALANLLEADTSGLAARLKTSWAPGAAIWLYACDAAISSVFTKAMAQTFGVEVKAFAEEVWYFPEFTSSPDRIVDRGWISVGSSEQGADAIKTKKLHELDQLATSTKP